MFATLNLALTPHSTLDTSGESPVSLPLPAGELPQAGVPGFAGLLRYQLGAGEADAFLNGNDLPQGGNVLPPPVSESVDIELPSALDWEIPFDAADEATVVAESLAPVWTPLLANTEVTVPRPQTVSIVSTQSTDIGETAAAVSARLPDLQRTLLDTQAIEAAARTVQTPVPMDAVVTTPVLSTQIRDIAPNDRNRGPIEFPVGTGDATDTLRAAGLPDTERVPRLQAISEVAVVPDRAKPGIAAATTATLANAINQVTGTAIRDPGLAELTGNDLVRTPVMDPAWGDRLGQRVVMMAGNQIQQAEIRLTPAELGPVRVQIAVEDGATNVTFQVQHAVTREAIEAAMPRLREMLSDNGLSLGQTNVSGDSVAEGQRERSETASTPRQAEADAELVDDASVERRKSVTTDGLIDTFA